MGRQEHRRRPVLFESIESVESYLSSEFWEGVLKDTEWDNDTLKYELYRVGDLPLVA